MSARTKRHFLNIWLLWIGTAIPIACTTTPHHKQVSDPAFDAMVAAPALAEKPLKLLFDDAHDNFHRSDGRYAPFVKLVTNDGVHVTSNSAPFDAASLKPYDVLVIVNARTKSLEESAFTPDEIRAVHDWVTDGGAMLPVADHSPFGRAANALSEQFGVSMLDGHLKDEVQKDPSMIGPFFLLFSAENRLLGDHPILAGKQPSERITRLVTFGGQALRVNTPADVLLRLSPAARVVKDLKQPDISEPPGANAAHAVALQPGRGRVVIIGEAAALTAQVISGDAAKPFGVAELRIGMSRTDADNKQFALNIVRWLAGKL